MGGSVPTPPVRPMSGARGPSPARRRGGRRTPAVQCSGPAAGRSAGRSGGQSVRRHSAVVQYRPTRVRSAGSTGSVDLPPRYFRSTSRLERSGPARRGEAALAAPLRLDGATKKQRHRNRYTTKTEHIHRNRRTRSLLRSQSNRLSPQLYQKLLSRGNIYSWVGTRLRRKLIPLAVHAQFATIGFFQYGSKYQHKASNHQLVALKQNFDIHVLQA